MKHGHIITAPASCEVCDVIGFLNAEGQSVAEIHCRFCRVYGDNLLGWFGHIHRMPETSVVKKIYKWKPLTGRPKSRWEDDIRNDMRQMKIVKWTEHVQDRPKWKVIAEKAKTLPEL
jgi:inhibitor of KinA sporulation pathway (predicted exonuclease)